MATKQIVLQIKRPARRRLERMSQKTQDKTTFRRCQIVLQAAAGKNRAAIGQALSCEVTTVSRTLKMYREQGEKGLERRVSPGRPPKLTDEQMKQLDETVAHEPRHMGKNYSNWSSQRLGQELALPVHPVTVQRYLKRLGWRWRRPRHRIASPDPRYGPKRRYLRRLERQALREEIRLYYADEVDIALLPTLCGRWMRLSQQHVVDTPGQNRKTYGFGAVNILTGALAWLLWPNKNNLGFRHLLCQVRDMHLPDPVPVVVVVDNYRIHKTHAVNQLLVALKGRLRLYFLPTYSPTLNPIERLWRYLRQEVTSNYFFKSLARLQTAVESFLTDLAASPAVILSIVNVS